MHTRLRHLILVLAALVTPSFSAAQQANAKAAPAAGPRIDAVVTGFRTPDHRVNAVSLQQRQSVGKPVALMIVGGAAIVLGAVIGGDIGLLFMIGGAVALLLGLYRYLQ
jgi:hypothetical protein